MKAIRLALAPLLLLLSIHPAAADPADTNTPTLRLTVDLRDGSRVIGESGSEHWKFHSALLGDLKLAVKDIRSVECVATNSARLVTANDDTLMVWFEDSEVTAKTSFGKVTLAVDSIRKITVSGSGGTGARRPGLVALWSGENNGKDAIGGNDAELTDIDFTDGQVGRAFLLNGFSSWMKIPSNDKLDVGKGDGLTVTAWIKPTNVRGFHPILEWEVTRQKDAVTLWLGHLPQDRGVLLGNIGDTAGQNHMLFSGQGALLENQFQHVALTYDKNTGVGRLFLNGRVVAEENMGVFTPDTTGDLFISRRPADQPGDWTYNTFFGGLLDEVAIYNRALSKEEIQAICLEDNHGEQLPPPASSEIMPFRQNDIRMMDGFN